MDEYNIDILETEASIEETEEVATVSTSDDAVGITPLDSETTHTETVEYIMVEEPEEFEIKIDEAFVGTNGVVMPVHTHRVSEIETLENVLYKLSSVTEKKDGETIYNDHYSAHGGYAEFRQWYVNSDINEVGRFVSLVYHHDKDPLKDGNALIEVCSTKHADVYGVTVQDSAFCGYQDLSYCTLKSSPDRNKDPLTFAKVCILGVVSVRQGATYKNAKVGDYVVPDDQGCAVLSENNIGFRVVGVGQLTGAADDRWNYRYVDVALVPQNDNVARVMAELEGAKQNLGNLSIQIGKLEDKIDKSITSIIPGLNETITDLNGVVQGKLDAANTVLNNAQDIYNKAEAAIETAKTEYIEAIKDAQETIEQTNGALSDVRQIKEDLTVLDAYKDGNTSGIAGFVAQVEKDKSTLATLNNKYGENGTEITLINQKIDENGAAIQHLVAHADKYSVGDYSLTHNLAYDEAFGLLDISEYIYVPTSKHAENSPMHISELNMELLANTEYYVSVGDGLYSFSPQDDWDEGTILTFNVKTKELIVGDRLPVILYQPVKVDPTVEIITFSTEKSQDFEKGKVYVWCKNADTNLYEWQESNIKVALGVKPKQEDLEEGYLWYCHDGVLDNDVYSYNPRTLYRYNAAKKTWFPVARTNDSNARTMSFINQTAKEISSTVTNLEGNMSEISQTVDEINSTVLGEDGIISRINQTAENITLGAYNPGGGVSSLEILLNGMRGVSNYSEHVLVGEFDGSPVSTVKKYTTAPIWSKDGFSFAEAVETTEEDYPVYYFNSDKTTYYCKQINSNTYEVYTIGNQAMANINTRVSDTESEIESWTLFESEAKDMMSAIKQSSTADAAELISMVSGIYTDCIETKSELSAGELALFQSMDKYSKKPIWKVKEDGSKGFVFDKEYKVDDGEYCTNNDRYYYFLELDESNGIVGYKKYEIKDSNYASIIQKTSEDKTSISLEAGGKKVNGGIFVEAINDEETSVLIEADKIGISGTAVFSDSLTDGKTTISGNYIKTGVITSNNYSGPVTYAMYGAYIGDRRVLSQSAIPKYSLPIVENVVTEDGKCLNSTVYQDGYYTHISGDVRGQFSTGFLYFIVNDEVCEIKITYRWEPNDDNTFFEYSARIPGVINELPESLDIYDSEDIVILPHINKTGDISKCIYYTPIVEGELTQKETIDGALQNIQYYCASEIKENESMVTKEEYDILLDGDKKSYQYYVSSSRFDLMPNNINTVGTKFDLNEGTIYSKSLYLDREGNLSITGKIAATSGYIGDEEYGFSICPIILVHDVSSKIEKGEYYFSYNGTYYSFETENAISRKNQIMCSVTDKKIYTSSGEVFTVNISNSKPSGAIKLDAYVKSYLSNQQESYKGGDDYGEGVYIGTDGIGLGNGAFYVDNFGKLTTYGNVYMYHEDATTKALVLEDNYLKSDYSLTIGGAITWSSTPSMKMLYSRTGKEKPPNYNYQGYTKYDVYPENDTTFNGEWHRIFDQYNDLYVSYSYDGGMTWSETFLYKSESSLSNVEKFNILTYKGKDEDGQEKERVKGILSFNHGYSDNNPYNYDLIMNADYINVTDIKATDINATNIDATNINGTLSGSVISKGSKNMIDIYGGYIDFKANNTGYTKMSLGCSAEDNPLPYIIFGAGTGNEGTAAGVPLRAGSLTMFKGFNPSNNSGYFRMQFLDSNSIENDVNNHIISFMDSVDDEDGYIQIKSCNKIVLDATKIIFKNGSSTPEFEGIQAGTGGYAVFG